MRKQKNNGFSSIFSSFLILIIVVAFIGFVYIFTDGLQTDIKTFYVKCNSTSFIGNYENYKIIKDKEYKFEVINTFGVDNELEISVVPNIDIEESSFEFYASSIYHQYCYEESLTAGFEIKSFNDYFTFKATKDLTDIISLNYPTQEITGCPTALDSGIPYFRLVVKSADLTQKININFSIVSE